MKKTLMAWLLIPVAALALSACSGSGGGGTIPTTNPITTNSTDTTAPIPPSPPTTPAAQAAAQVLTGIFVDAPVEGLTFVSGALSGITDAAGTFKFEAGKTVQFRVGNVILGQAPGKALMTPVDLVKAVDAAATVADPRVVQVSQFLMTVNSSATAAKMTIPGGVVTAAQNEVTVDLSQAPLGDAALATILGRLTTKTLVPQATAAAQIQATIGASTVAVKTGTFAAVDSATAPTLGLQVSVVPNLAGDAFDVTGVAATIDGSTWTVAGTMTTLGSLNATGTGTGAAPPTQMVITGAITSATQVTASANFTLNNVAKQVPLVFEKAIAPALTGKFGLPKDAGVATVAGDLVHVGADMTIRADGTISAHVVRSQITGVVALAAIYSTHFAGLTGVVTSAGNVIAIGGVSANTDAASNLNGKTLTSVSPVTFFTGPLDAVASTATIKMTAQDLNLAGPAATTLGFAITTNPFVGTYQGTHSDTAPGLPGTFTFGVNNDNSVHGFTMFLRQRPADIQQTPFQLDGVVNPATGALAQPPGFNLGGLGTVAAFPGLVMTDQEAVTNLTPGTFAGAINSATGVTSGTWQTGPGVLTTGTFTGNLLP